MIILIVDDEASLRNLLSATLGKTHTVIPCEDGAAALKALESTAIDVVVTDNQMPKLTGLELIRRGKELSPTTSFFLMTAFGSVEQAVEAIKCGADDYLMKPFDTSEIVHRITRIEELRAWRVETTLKKQAVDGLGRLIGTSGAMRQAAEFIRKVSVAPSPVLLLGPSGSGKEVVAKAIHEVGPRAMRPFIAINCASLGEQLMESELFGHEKGSFTGATAAKPGKFELAKGGTLFLDEVGELAPGLQAKLLRVLQEKEFFRVGGTRVIQSEARVITATHRPLKDMVKSGAFREDLFFRLNVLTFEVPRLSSRREDIPLLIRHFSRKFATEFGRKLVLAPATEALLARYDYPGNVRELQNVLERLAVLAPPGAPIGPELLPAEFHGAAGETHTVRSSTAAADVPSPPAATTVVEEAPAAESGVPVPSLWEWHLKGGLPARMDEIERIMIAEAMRESGNSQLKAAEVLRISRGALQYKLKKYGFSVPPVDTAQPPGDSEDEAA